MEKPTVMHLNAVKRIIRYIKGTLEYGLVYSSVSRNNVLTGYSDSDLAGHVEDRKSTSGVVFYLNESLITEGIGFPFWGVGIRDQDCGLKGLELRCDGNDLVVNIGPNIKYHVVDFNLSTKALKLRHDDKYLEHICKPDSGSISEIISSGKPYDYGERTKDL
ncbi:hypothetical protein AgCh_008194 [Apium graveolens]